jgi:hypothetical protein
MHSMIATMSKRGKKTMQALDSAVTVTMCQADRLTDLHEISALRVGK